MGAPPSSKVGRTWVCLQASRDSGLGLLLSTAGAPRAHRVCTCACVRPCINVCACMCVRACALCVRTFACVYARVCCVCAHAQHFTWLSTQKAGWPVGHLCRAARAAGCLVSGQAWPQCPQPQRPWGDQVTGHLQLLQQPGGSLIRPPLSHSPDSQLLTSHPEFTHSPAHTHARTPVRLPQHR